MQLLVVFVAAVAQIASVIASASQTVLSLATANRRLVDVFYGWFVFFQFAGLVHFRPFLASEDKSSNTSLQPRKEISVF
ncbi:hypothetical protein [Variovorax sp. 770b2]|uniref:hypothetical protein n=1 Tax=Variovorax sp. 770b2 TaxID=1566271 RepID=UPI000B858442|nr:hypothetical protein [Variovorax sp. 770b2]